MRNHNWTNTDHLSHLAFIGLMLQSAAPVYKPRINPTLLSSSPRTGECTAVICKRNFANPIAKGLARVVGHQRRHQCRLLRFKLGSRAYGGPVMSDGRILIGTNNEFPRDPAIKGDKGVMMCFRREGRLVLWQIVHDKLSRDVSGTGRNKGICSTPCIEGDRFYYTSAIAAKPSVPTSRRARSTGRST